ncbi:hypothetical protein [Streptomyces sp. NPDC002276]
MAERGSGSVSAMTTTATVSRPCSPGCAGLSAELIAERIKRLVHEFGGRPPEDDMALLVLQAE